MLIYFCSVIRRLTANIIQPIKHLGFLILGLLMLGGFNIAYAQESDAALIDSLNQVIIKNESALNVAEAYVGLTEIIYVTTPDTVIPLCQKAIDLIDQHFEQSDTAAQRQLLIVKATAYNNIGFMYDNEGQISKALEIYFKAIKIQEQLGDKQGLASSYNNTGYIFRQQEDYENARNYYLKSKAIKIELKDTMGLANTMLNLGGLADHEKKYEESKNYYLESLRLWKSTGVKRGIAAATNNLGYILNVQGKSDSALIFYKQALEIYEELNHREGIGSVNNNLATIYYKEKAYPEALVYAEKALKIGREIEYIENIKDASYILEQIYFRTEDWKEAHAMSVLYNDMKDSLFNQETKRASLKKELNYEFEKKEAVKEVEYQKERALTEVQKQQQRTILIVVSIGLFLVFILSIIIYKRLLITRKQRNLISNQQDEILNKNEELNQQNEEIKAISEKIEDQNTLLSSQNRDIVSSIQYAQKIQHTILPPLEKMSALLPHSFVLYLPKDIVSGDFYWMHHRAASEFNSDNLLYLAVVDCTGHGVPGAFMSIIGSNGLKQVIKEEGITDPAQILERLTAFVIEQVNANQDEDAIADGMDISLCSLNLDTNQLKFAGAYNPLYLIRDNTLQEFKGTKRPVGYFRRKNMPVFQTHTIQLEKDDMIYLFTDGYADQFGGSDGRKYTYRKMREKMLEWHSMDPNLQREAFLSEYQNWKGLESQLDDICVIGFGI